MMRGLRAIITISLMALLLVAGVTDFGPVHPSGTVAEARSRRAESKLSDDLKDKTRGRAAVKVIIQTTNDDDGDSDDADDLASVIGRRGGNVKRRYENVNGLAAEVPGDALEELASRPDVAHISLDRPIRATGHLETTTGTDQARRLTSVLSGTIDGRGVGIAILDSGVNQTHHAFLDPSATSRKLQYRFAANVDFSSSEPQSVVSDSYGHGTHVASIAAGNAHVADGAYTGIAPGASIINVRVLNNRGEGTTSDALAAIDWVIRNKETHKIRVMNLSFGAVAVDSYKRDPLCLAVARAWRAGIVVVVAAGNNGKDENGQKIYGAVHSPGIEPSVITVGAANTFGTDVRVDDAIASYSSRGPTRGYSLDTLGRRKYDNIIKPNIVAPGNKIIAAQSMSCHLVRSAPWLDATTSVTVKSYHDVMYMSGTSMAAPAVAGAAALVLQRNPNLTPNLIKAVLEYTAQPLAGFNTLEQGAGLLNVEGAVRLAGLITTTNLSSLTNGTPMLVGPTPPHYTSIAGSRFQWSSGYVQNWNVISGVELITRFQGIYRSGGTLLSDGVMLTNNGLALNTGLMSRGVILSDGVLFADGTTITGGTLFVNGITISEGVLLTDGTLLSDGVVKSDCNMNGSESASATFTGQSVLTDGDPGISMAATTDNCSW